MKRCLAILVLFLLFIANPALALKWRWAPETDFRSPDKLSHFLAGNYLTTEFSQWRFANGNRWIGFATMSGVMDIGWEGKDGLVDYETYGRIGAEGYDYKDVVMNTAGGLFGIRLHDQFLVWIGLKEEIIYPRLSRGMCQQPISELWPVLGRRLIYAGVYVGGCYIYNYLDTGEITPHRSEFYENPNKSGFLETLNSESSFIIPWTVNAELRPYLPLSYRYPAMIFTVFIFEGANGTWDDRDVPWFGDREGAKEGDVWTGVISAHLAVVYDLLFYPKDITCEIRTTVGPTPDGGFGLMRLSEKSAWFISAVLPDNGGAGINFRISF